MHMSAPASSISLEQNEQFLKKAYGKTLIPCMLSILSGNINILADGILVGQRLGTNALAAGICLTVREKEQLSFWILHCK